jgi:uncharacterized integral membrane protein
MLAIGGWLGISYNDARIDRLAAVIFGAGGGLIGDEAGLLLTFENYWTGLTYTIITGFLAIAFILILIAKYSRTIMNEFVSFVRNNASLYFGVFLATISIAFLMDTDNPIIIAASSASAATGCLIILAYLIQRITRKKRSRKKERNVKLQGSVVASLKNSKTISSDNTLVEQNNEGVKMRGKSSRCECPHLGERIFSIRKTDSRLFLT